MNRWTLTDFSTHRLHSLTVLDLGLFDVGPGKRTIGIPGFLLQTGQGARILVDTGFDPLYATDAEAAEARDGLSSFGKLLGFSPRQTLAGQLALLGLGLGDIDALILTHGHIDHVGSLPLLRCPVYLTSAERAEPKPTYFGSVRSLDWPELEYRQIDRDTQIAKGITLLPTPGHTPGHLSVLLHLPGGAAILTGDAINRASEPDEGFPDAMDPVAAAHSAQRLFELARTHDAALLFGHEPTQWAEWPKAPNPWKPAAQG